MCVCLPFAVLLSTNSVSAVLSLPELEMHLPLVQPGLPLLSALFAQKCCKAGVCHTSFLGSHEESLGMWDATTDTFWVSELLFLRGTIGVGGDKQGSSLETKHSCVGEGKGLFGLFFEMFALNKVHWCLKKTIRGYSTGMKSTVLPSCTCWSSSRRKASKLPSPQVFPPAPSFQDLEFIFGPELLAACTILTCGCSLVQFGDKSFPSRGSGREQGGAPCSADLIVKCLSQALQGLDTPGYAVCKVVHGLG